MTREDMNQYLESINGLENGYKLGEPPIKDCGIFGVGLGWYPLIKDLISDLIELGWDKQTCQVKEKFGGLRFYINAGSSEIHERISKAERDSYEICEVCGGAGELRRNGWYSTLCDNHVKKNNNE